MATGAQEDESRENIFCDECFEFFANRKEWKSHLLEKECYPKKITQDYLTDDDGSIRTKCPATACKYREKDPVKISRHLANRHFVLAYYLADDESKQFYPNVTLGNKEEYSPEALKRPVAAAAAAAAAAQETITTWHCKVKGCKHKKITSSNADPTGISKRRNHALKHHQSKVVKRMFKKKVQTSASLSHDPDLKSTQIMTVTSSSSSSSASVLPSRKRNNPTSANGVGKKRVAAAVDKGVNPTRQNEKKEASTLLSSSSNSTGSASTVPATADGCWDRSSGGMGASADAEGSDCCQWRCKDCSLEVQDDKTSLMLHALVHNKSEPMVANPDGTWDCPLCSRVGDNEKSELLPHIAADHGEFLLDYMELYELIGEKSKHSTSAEDDRKQPANFTTEPSSCAWSEHHVDSGEIICPICKELKTEVDAVIKKSEKMTKDMQFFQKFKDVYANHVAQRMQDMSTTFQFSFSRMRAFHNSKESTELARSVDKGHTELGHCNYLFLDAKLLDDLAERIRSSGGSYDIQEGWLLFLSSVFYVGEGGLGRPSKHFNDEVKNATRTTEAKKTNGIKTTTTEETAAVVSKSNYFRYLVISGLRPVKLARSRVAFGREP